MKSVKTLIIGMIIVSFFIVSAIYWNSWQDYGDDFNDEIINTTFWDTAAQYCCFGGGLCGNSNNAAYVNETGNATGDGYLQLYVNNFGGSGGYVVNSYTGLLGTYNYKDGRSYLLNFTTEFTTTSGSPNKIIALTNHSDLGTPTCGGAGGDMANTIDYVQIRDFGTQVIVNRSYALILTYINDSTYNITFANSTTILNSSQYSRNAMYFYQTASVGGYGGVGGKIINYNFTSKSIGVKTNVYLLNPSNGTIVNHYNPSFLGQFNMSDPPHNITNATFFLYNLTGSILNRTEISLGSNSSSILYNLTIYGLNYTSYIWNYHATGTDGTNFDSSSGSNRTIIINDTQNPSLVITSPIGTVTSRTIDIRINTSDYGGLSYCYFNITRATTTEVANTQIPNCQNTTASVSLDADFVLNILVNDTVNNRNFSNSSFTVDTSISPGGSSSSEGGGFRISDITQARNGTSSLCQPYKPILDDAWKYAKQNEFRAGSLNKLFEAFYNYIICKSAASIVPI